MCEVNEKEALKGRPSKQKFIEFPPCSEWECDHNFNRTCLRSGCSEPPCLKEEKDKNLNK